MESWRKQLYQTLSHSVEGSTWKDHKYIAIVDGKYIYPEDVQNGGNTGSSASQQSTVNTGSSITTTSTREPKKVKKQKDSNGNSIDVTDKGNVKTARELPTEAALGDMYFIEDTKTYAYWNGKQWTPVDESQAPAASGVGGGGSGGSKKGDSELSEDTVDRAREAVKKTYGTTSHKKEPIKLNAPASSVSNSRQVSAGKKAVSGKLKNTLSKAVSSIKNTKLYKAGAKLIVKLKGGSSNPIVSRTRGVQR